MASVIKSMNYDGIVKRSAPLITFSSPHGLNIVAIKTASGACSPAQMYATINRGQMDKTPAFRGVIIASEISAVRAA